MHAMLAQSYRMCLLWLNASVSKNGQKWPKLEGAFERADAWTIAWFWSFKKTTKRIVVWYPETYHISTFLVHAPVAPKNRLLRNFEIFICPLYIGACAYIQIVVYVDICNSELIIMFIMYIQYATMFSRVYGYTASLSCVLAPDVNFVWGHCWNWRLGSFLAGAPGIFHYRYTLT